MKAVPEPPKERVEWLYDIAQGAVKFTLLCTAIDFNVHDFFETPRTAGAFAESAQTDPELTEKFLNALAAIGLLVKEDTLYMNSPEASAYLVSHKPFFQGDMLKLMHHGLIARWTALGTCLKEGPLSLRPEKAQVLNQDAITAIAQWALSGGTQAAVQALASLPEFSRARRLLDVGGGHGLYTIAFCQENPQLKGVVLDLPQVIEVTEDNIAWYEMQGRVKTLPGDYATADWGGKYDIIFAADVFFKERELMEPIVRKIRDSLTEGGLFVSKHQRMDEKRTSPVQTVLHDLMLFLMRPFPPHTYTVEESSDLFRSGGFEVETFDVNIPHSPSTIMICRKGNLTEEKPEDDVPGISLGSDRKHQAFQQGDRILPEEPLI